MKKLTKRDFKKMALMGIAGGAMLSAQASASDQIDTKDYSNALAANCAGAHASCSQVAYRNIPQTSSQYNYSNAPQQVYGPQNQPFYPQASAGCGFTQPNAQPYYSQPQGYPQPNAQPYYSQPQGYPQPQVSAGCGSFNPPAYTRQPQVAASCGGFHPPQGQPVQPQTIAGCGAFHPQSQPMMPQSSAIAGCGARRQAQSSNSNAYSQWETADTTRALPPSNGNDPRNHPVQTQNPNWNPYSNTNK